MPYSAHTPKSCSVYECAVICVLTGHKLRVTRPACEQSAFSGILTYVEDDHTQDKSGLVARNNIISCKCANAALQIIKPITHDSLARRQAAKCVLEIRRYYYMRE